MSIRVCVALFAVLCLPHAASAVEGALDPSFGSAGVARIPLNYVSAGRDQASTLLVLPDGRVLVGGVADVPAGNSSQQEQTVLRLRADGSGLDTSFGSAGVRRVGFSNGRPVNSLRALHRLADGRLLGAGDIDVGSGFSASRDFTVFRLGAEGALDPSFDLDGRRQLDLGSNDELHALAVYPDGRILLAGSKDDGVDVCGTLLRLLADGSSDPSFAGGGSLCLSPGGGYPAFTRSTGTLILADGRLVLSGFTATNMPGGASRFRFFAEGRLANGALDTSFGSGGSRLVSFDQGSGSDDFALASARQADGRIVLAGRSTTSLGTDIAVARLLADGSLDSSFGSGGRVLIPLDFSPGGLEIAEAIAVQPDGRIVLAGWAVRDSNGNTSGFVLRLLPNGQLDPSFGSGGVVTILPTVVGGGQDRTLLRALAIVGGRIYATGSVRGPAAGGDYDMLVVRLQGAEMFRNGFEAP